MKPVIDYQGPGRDLVLSSLQGWQREDISGHESDRLTLTLVGESVLQGWPPEGDEIQWFEGLSADALVDKGRFKITQVTPRLFPPSLTLTATAAPLAKDDPWKQRKSRSHSATTLGALVRSLAEEHQLSPRVATNLAKITLPHIDQQDESDMALLTRLAAKEDAVCKPINGLLVLAKRGETKSLSGQQLPIITLQVPPNNTPSDPGFIQCQLQCKGRTRYNGAECQWFDNDGNEQWAQAGRAPFSRALQMAPDEARAIAIAKAEYQKVRRQSQLLQVSLPGNPHLVAEGRLDLGEGFPAAWQGEWSIDQVSVTGGESGYRCDVKASSLSGTN